jgi:uncharacterized protein YhbP (UPF0306 family)
MTREELEKIILDFMDSLNTATLACSSEDEPWSAPVYYARQGFDLIFFSSRKSRHSGLFQANPRAAASIYGLYQSWQDIRGLQMSGRVEALTSLPAIARAANIYFKRFPFARDFFSKSGFLSDALAKTTRIALYAFRTSSVHYLDNSVGFGIRWKLDIQDGRPIGSPEHS